MSGSSAPWRPTRGHVAAGIALLLTGAGSAWYLGAKLIIGGPELDTAIAWYLGFPEGVAVIRVILVVALVLAGILLALVLLIAIVKKLAKLKKEVQALEATKPPMPVGVQVPVPIAPPPPEEQDGQVQHPSREDGQ